MQNNFGPGTIGRIFTMIGNANLKLKKNDAAVAAYTKAAKIDPNAAVAYFNLCVTLHNMGEPAAKSVPACDKAIAADPKKADTYFIKGSIMLGEATIDKKTRPLPRLARWKRTNNILSSLPTVRTQTMSRPCSNF